MWYKIKPINALLIMMMLILYLFIENPVLADTTSIKQKKLIICGSDNYPPFIYINADGNPEGFNVDILKALMPKLGYAENEYDFKLGNWYSIDQEVDNNKIVVIAGMVYTPELAENLSFGLPICTINRVIVSRNKDNYKTIEDLKGKRVIIQNKLWSNIFLGHKVVPSKIIIANNIDESLKMLMRGEGDAIIDSELVSYYSIRKYGLTDISIADMKLAPLRYSIAVENNNDKFIYQLNIGLQSLKAEGRYDEIYDKWFGVYNWDDKMAPYIIASAVIASLVLLLLIFIWLLRRQVAISTRKLKYSQQEIGLAINAGGIIAWSYDIDTKIFYELHGNTLNSTIRTINDLRKALHPEDFIRFIRAFDKLIKGTEKEIFDCYKAKSHKTKDYRTYETKMLRIEKNVEQPSRIVGTLKDVTEEIVLHKTLEEYLLKINFITTTNGIILFYYDLSAQQFYRLNANENVVETILSPDEYKNRVFPDDLKLSTDFIDSMQRGTEMHISAEYRLLSDENSYEWFAIEAVAYKHNSNGDIISYLGLRRNNTKWKQTTEDLIKLRNKAEASNKLKSAFLANMSHEIRTPLNAIVGFSNLIAESNDVEEKVQFMSIIRANNDLLLQLINDVLDLSKIESGFVDFKYSKFEFSSYFKDIYTAFSMRAPSGVKLVSNAPSIPVDLYSDKNRVTQIITNFVTNAFKFTKQGEVTLDYICEDEWLKIFVTDTGIGISEENQKKVFDRFEKLNEFAQGTGLGLSICRSLVEAMNGKIGVKSTVGVGSTFWVWLPYTPDISDIMGAEIMDFTSYADINFNYTPSEADYEINNKKKIILIAEDIDNNFTLAKELLKDDYNIVRAVNGVEAVDITRKIKPDIILMDMKMPIMDGLEATQKIREFNTDVPIIALTAYVFDTNRELALRKGCNGFISKPLRRETLNDELSKFHKE